KLLCRARHIEVQILGDLHGTLVHLFERDCSVQRRHQKVVEWAPARCLTEAERERLCAAALTVARAAGYTTAATVACILDGHPGSDRQASAAACTPAGHTRARACGRPTTPCS